MVSKRVMVTFVLPVVFSIVFASLVFNDILQKPDRELNMLPMMSSEKSSSHDSIIEIIGLSKQYSTSQPVEIRVKLMICLSIAGIFILQFILLGRMM